MKASTEHNSELQLGAFFVDQRREIRYQMSGRLAFNKGGTATNVRPFREGLFLCLFLKEEENMSNKNEAVLTQEQQVKVNEQVEALMRGVVEVVPEEAFRKKIEKSVLTGKPLNIKLGMDPQRLTFILVIQLFCKSYVNFKSLATISNC